VVGSAVRPKPSPPMPPNRRRRPAFASDDNRHRHPRNADREAPRCRRTPGLWHSATREGSWATLTAGRRRPEGSCCIAAGERSARHRGQGTRELAGTIPRICVKASCSDSVDSARGSSGRPTSRMKRSSTRATRRTGCGAVMSPSHATHAPSSQAGRGSVASTRRSMPEKNCGSHSPASVGAVDPWFAHAATTSPERRTPAVRRATELQRGAVIKRLRNSFLPRRDTARSTRDAECVE
jgi:hypothetical protein